MLRIAFASTDQTRVDLHFGAAERFVVYDVSPGRAELVAVGEFVPAVMKGDNRFLSLPQGTIVPGEDMVPTPEELQRPPEDKVVAKLEFLKDCAAVYAASIGTSSIKRLMAAGIQPIIVDSGSDIVELLNEVSLALGRGGRGLAWVEKALARTGKAADRFDTLAEQGWDGGAGLSRQPAAG
jgi:nitrogen fixation protein NifX